MILRTPNPHHSKCTIAPHAHPLVREFFELVEYQRIGVTDIAERSGLGLATIVKWRRDHSPTLVCFEAALNVLGYELAIRQIRRAGE